MGTVRGRAEGRPYDDGRAEARPYGCGAVGLFVGGLAVACLAVACGEDGAAPGAGDDGGVLLEDPARPGREAGADAQGAGDAGPTDAAGGGDGDGGAVPPEVTCAQERTFVETCRGELTCGAAGFDAWCKERVGRVDSAQRARAIAACFRADLCQERPRLDCVYGHYARERRTASQEALLAAYCATCEPGDLAGCAARTTTYDAAAGPASVTDQFLAVWELADPLVDGIRAQCTGADAGAGAADAGASACARAFSRCAGGVYVDALPDCP